MTDRHSVKSATGMQRNQRPAWREIRSLDRGAAKEAFSAFLSDNTLSANQIEFLNLIINHLTEHGVMDAARLYESPFTDLAMEGPDGIFESQRVDQLVATLNSIRSSAVAA